MPQLSCSICCYLANLADRETEAQGWLWRGTSTSSSTSNSSTDVLHECCDISITHNLAEFPKVP